MFLIYSSRWRNLSPELRFGQMFRSLGWPYLHVHQQGHYKVKWLSKVLQCLPLNFVIWRLLYLKQAVLWREDWVVFCLAGLVHGHALPSCLHWTVCLLVRSHYSGSLPSQVRGALGELPLLVFRNGWLNFGDVHRLWACLLSLSFEPPFQSFLGKFKRLRALALSTHCPHYHHLWLPRK